MPDLIYSRKSNAETLSIAQLASQAPAAFSTKPIEGVSDRYGHVTTLDAVNKLERAGWLPVQAAQTSSRTKKAREHTKHLIAFAQEGDIGAGEGRPEIVLYNSSDRSSALKLYAGYFRWICSNSLVSGSGFESKLIHNKSQISSFDTLLDNTFENLTRSSENIKRMQETQITSTHAQHLAELAASTRWKSIKSVPYGDIPAGTYWTNETIRSLLARKRYSDEAIGGSGSITKHSLWEVFNRIQEGVMRSGASVASVTEKSPMGSERRARSIASVSQAIKINRNLWDICEEAA